MAALIRRYAGAFQLVFVIGIVGLALLVSASLRPEQGAVRSASAPQAAGVSVVEPVPVDYNPVLRLNGVVEARAVTNVIPQVMGRVVEVAPNFRPGAQLDEGDVLFVIDSADYELAVDRTLAEIEAARSELALLEAEAAAERQIWESQFPNRQIPDLIARVPQIAAAKARIHSAEAARNAAMLDLSRTTVRAPFPARVLDTRLDVGQVVGNGSAIGSIFALDALEIAIPVSSAELARLTPAEGRTVRVIADTLGSKSKDGEIVRIAAALDDRTRLGKLFVRIDDATRLTVGEFVTVEVDGATTANAYRLPASALTSQGQLWVVADGRLASRNIELLGVESGTAIVAAFDAADGIVELPPPDGRDGMPVRVDTPARFAAAGGTTRAAD